MEREQARSFARDFDGDARDDDDDLDLGPGRMTRTARLKAPREPIASSLVQRRADGAQRADDDDVHAIAQAGVAGAGGPLPHFDAIQRAFGPDHDVSHVRAHVGGAAAQAASQIGAAAYATGSSIAFARAPDLFTAAHEAAHVVQQRAGVQLLGGVGVDGDAHEQHADLVAARVVRGESAADLLGAYSGRGASVGVQRLSAIRRDAVAAMDRIRQDLGPSNESRSSTRGGAFEKYVMSHAAVMNEWSGPERRAAIKVKEDNGEELTKADKDFVRDYDDPTSARGNGLRKRSFTSCTTFNPRFASEQLGLAGRIGTFNIATQGPFVKSGQGAFPREGDSVKVTKNAAGKAILHVCISYNAPQKDGDTWQVMEGGQGSFNAGSDALAFHTKTFNSSEVEGWIDIDGEAVAETAPQLAGTWEVTIDGDSARYRYTFGADGSASWVNAADPAQSGGGRWERAHTQVELTWKPSNTTEAWKLSEIKKKEGASVEIKASGATNATTFKKIA
jgi:hypothetical protein